MEHPRDTRIHFDPEPHVYTVDGDVFTSVTSVIDQFFPSFDAEAMAARCAGKGKYIGMTASDVEDAWRKNGEAASEAGTALHLAIEHFLLERKPSDLPEFPMWLDWYQASEKKLGHVVRLEWAIFDEEFGVAGMLDALFQSPKGLYFLLDWKRKKAIKKQAFTPTDRAHEPIRHLPNCDYARASLQLNVYRKILKKHYGIEVAFMGLIQCHPEAPFQTHRVQPMEAEVDAVLEAFKASSNEL